MNAPDHVQTAAAYLRFADEEAHGRSPLYEELARSTASDPAMIRFLLTLPAPKRQPNLLFAAVRFLFGTPRDFREFRRIVVDNADAIRALMLARSTQTNEPGRCATLLPVLAMLPQPLALIEVGASAGLCLLPDCYDYDYLGWRLTADGTPPPRPVFPCATDGRTPLPSNLPRVVWRAGLDLSPVDLSDPEQAAWLEALVWPEQTDRLARLRAAMRIAAVLQPRVIGGDLRRDLAPLAARAPHDATLVIFHSAVLAYVSSPLERAEFARSIRTLCDFWVANEAPQVLPEIAARAGNNGRGGEFLVSVNGEPVAWADPHGASLAWIADPPCAPKTAHDQNPPAARATRN